MEVDLKNQKRIPVAPTIILSQILTDYYRTIRRAKKSTLCIAWSAVGFPKNLLLAMDIFPVYPQFHAAFQSRRGKSDHILREMEGRFEIPHDICGEVKSMIGTLLSGERSSVSLPPPDMIVSSNCVCSAAAKGMDFLQRHLDVPLFFIDTPFVSMDQTGAHAMEYMAAQQDEIIRAIEEKFEMRFDRERYNRLQFLDYTAVVVWREILKLCRWQPSPVDAMDLYFFYLPLFILNPEDGVLLDLLIKLYNDIYTLCRRNESRPGGAEHKDEIRLLWDILPVYNKTDFFKKKFSEYNASVVMSTYLMGSLLYPETMRLKFQFPINREKLVRISRENYVADAKGFEIYTLEQAGNRPLKHRKESMRRLIQDFSIEGVVMHMDRSCRPISLPQYELMKYVQEDLHVPALLFDADSMDGRYFSESQVSTRIDAFMERLESERNCA